MQTSEEWAHENAQEFANDCGKSFHVFLHQGIWNTWQDGAKPLPEGVKVTTYHPAPGSTPKPPIKIKIPNFR